jgi:ribosomal protein S18 acetylase RimI-like enzyme
MLSTDTIHARTYRLAAPHELLQLKVLGIAAYSCYETELTSDNLAIWQASLNDDAKLAALMSASQVLVCADGERLVGMAFLVPQGNPTPVYDAGWAYIRMVAVHPDFQGQGIAGELTRYCITAARTNGETIIALHTSEMMHAARHVYEKAGFTILRELDPIFGKRYWLYTLQL